ncbi:hypothetical protein [Brevundimonas sp.]|uniref:hypothetical protein n=1 Tax=Brevundimonas sp. TaxID=1871086 RepID=UPI0025C3B85C|nr:hypothetical protein [Brevundimonas sp.]
MTSIVVNSESWTGRSFYAETPIEWLKGEIHAALWPSFDCVDCIGMIQHGCQCGYYGAVAAGVGPEPWRVFLRRVFNGASA